MARRQRPRLAVLAGPSLFVSFFDEARQRRLSRSFDWTRTAKREMGPALRSLLAEVDGLITTWDSPRFGPELTALAPRLRIVAHCGGEVKGRFARSLFSDLTIANAPGPMAPYVAELAVAFLLMAARRIDDHREALARRSNRVYQEIHLHGCVRETLRGRHVGLVGLGRIGQGIAEMLRPFGPLVTAYDPYVSPRAARRLGVAVAPLRRLLACSEFLVLAAGLTRETRGMIDGAALGRLPDGATVVNVARGGLVDLDALTREVRRGRLRCAIDVTDPLEPLPVKHPLRRMRGALVTPHVGAAAVEVRHQMADVVLDSLEQFFAGGRPATRVTPAMLDLMT
jgi:phosphoglycerate dehydrogenase-like enzyme